MKTYRTIQGDMWDTIAYEQTGSVYHTGDLLRANMRYHRLLSFPAGVELTIPDVETSGYPDTAPPWKAAT